MGQTPLHMAVEHNQVDCVILLLKSGADPKAFCEKQGTPFDIALNLGFVKLKTLLEKKEVTESTYSMYQAQSKFPPPFVRSASILFKIHHSEDNFEIITQSSKSNSDGKLETEVVEMDPSVICSWSFFLTISRFLVRSQKLAGKSNLCTKPPTAVLKSCKHPIGIANTLYIQNTLITLGL
jgi:hypothetical protein